MRALVTGGAGFIGSNLVDGLLAHGADVHIIDDLSTGKRENLGDALSNGASLHVADVSEPTAVSEVAAAARPEVVFHLAAQIDVRRSLADPGFDARVNCGGTAVVLEAARRCGARRVVLASTAAVYGDPDELPIREETPLAPLSPYGVSKGAAEAYLGVYERLYGLSTLSLRLANVYGPRQDPHGEAGVIAIFCGAAAGGTAGTIFGDGRQTRDYVYVGDVVSAFLAAADSSVSGAVNIGTGRETSVLDLVAELELRAEQAPGRPGEIARSCLDPSRAEAMLSWRAQMTLADGLRRTLEAVDHPPG